MLWNVSSVESKVCFDFILMEFDASIQRESPDSLIKVEMPRHPSFLWWIFLDGLPLKVCLSKKRKALSTVHWNVHLKYSEDFTLSKRIFQRCWVESLNFGSGRKHFSSFFLRNTQEKVRLYWPQNLYIYIKAYYRESVLTLDPITFWVLKYVPKWVSSDQDLFLKKRKVGLFKDSTPYVSQQGKQVQRWTTRASGEQEAKKTRAYRKVLLFFRFNKQPGAGYHFRCSSNISTSSPKRIRGQTPKSPEHQK